MRFILTVLLWLMTTVVLAVAVPAAWLQVNVIDADGYAAFTQKAATDPGLQQAMAGELTTQVLALADDDGLSLTPAVVRAAANSYTRSSAFPEQFAEANRFAHRWLFTDSVTSSVDGQGRWVIDLAPMLSNNSLGQTLDSYNIDVPTSFPVPLTEDLPDVLRPGGLQQWAAWGPWVSVGAAVLTGVLALLTLAAARSRGKTLAALGVSALLVGGAGWAGLEVGRRYVDNALNQTSGDIRTLADSVVTQAISSMHQWLNWSLIVGGGLVALGVVVAMLGGLRSRD
ncbi:hypothetical protein [Mycolicibacterium palauense]|uniref:hypothetical protein n=1 Tax=Mycolicibacterium palauense TaxID=2034511 RepID=UPI000BFEDD1A|nr:hypothetical protein [Mycolicibacterium palauense]